MENNKPTLAECWKAVTESVLEMNRLTIEYNKKVAEFVTLVNSFHSEKEHPCVK